MTTLKFTQKQLMLIIDMSIDFEDIIRETYTEEDIKTFDSLCILLDDIPIE